MNDNSLRIVSQSFEKNQKPCKALHDKICLKNVYQRKIYFEKAADAPLQAKDVLGIMIVYLYGG